MHEFDIFPIIDELKSKKLFLINLIDLPKFPICISSLYLNIILKVLKIPVKRLAKPKYRKYRDISSPLVKTLNTKNVKINLFRVYNIKATKRLSRC